MAKKMGLRRAGLGMCVVPLAPPARPLPGDKDTGVRAQLRLRRSHGGSRTVRYGRFGGGRHEEGALTEDKVRGIVCNPIYAGLGPFPRIISDAQWVRSAAKLVDEDGAEQFVVNLLHVLRETFPTDQDGS